MNIQSYAIATSWPRLVTLGDRSVLDTKKFLQPDEDELLANLARVKEYYALIGHAEHGHTFV